MFLEVLPYTVSQPTSHWGKPLTQARPNPIRVPHPPETEVGLGLLGTSSQLCERGLSPGTRFEAKTKRSQAKRDRGMRREMSFESQDPVVAM